MPQYRTLNKDFFKNWSPDMAYVLGYIAADGAITIGKRGNQYVEVQSVDRELPAMVRKALGSNHKISSSQLNPRWQVKHRLQIGSKEMVKDLAGLGIVPKKTNRLVLPEMPKKYFRDFVRGYFDGDGCIHCGVYKRSGRERGVHRAIKVQFTSCSRQLLEGINNQFITQADVNHGGLVQYKSYYRLNYNRKGEIEKIFYHLYEHKPKLYLKRKYVYFRDTLRKIRGPVV